MKISPVCSSLNFCSKSKEIRKADDIQRKARQVFPAVSSTYIADNYLCTNREYLAQQINIGILSSIVDYRREISANCLKNRLWGLESHFMSLEELKSQKKGNCYEMACAAEAALYANGYQNTKVANLYFKSALVDKKTGEVVDEYHQVIDHDVTLTDMNTGGEKNIVVDMWLGFAASKQEANAKYKAVFLNKYLKEKDNAAKIFGDYDSKRYMQVCGFIYKEKDDKTAEEKQEHTEKVKNTYSELII